MKAAGLQRRYFVAIQLMTLFFCFSFSLNLYAQVNPVNTISWEQALEQEPSWYSTTEAVRIADNLLLYQHDSGGWSKNIDMAKKLSHEEKTEIQKSKAVDGSTFSGPTIDNGATFTQLRYLARVYEQTDHQRYKESFLQGMDYLLDAQYENGGWPQYYPIREGYYEDITFNDGAMIGVMKILRDISAGEHPFGFVDSDRQNLARISIEKGVDVILKTQIEVDGKLTAWCAQYDHEDLTPSKARAYEHVSISGSESVGIVNYLMEIENPSEEVITAVKSAVEWFEMVKLTDIRIIRIEDPSLPGGSDRVIGFNPIGSPPLWGRFYEIGTNYPIFADRDGTVKYSYSQISHERRNNYGWLGDWPYKLLNEDYPSWNKRLGSE